MQQLEARSHTFKLWSHTLLDNHWRPFVLFGFWLSLNHIYCLNIAATCHWLREIKHSDAVRLTDQCQHCICIVPALASADIISSWCLLWLQADGGDNIKTSWPQPLRKRLEPSTHVYTKQTQANYLNDILANALIKYNRTHARSLREAVRRVSHGAAGTYILKRRQSARNSSSTPAI